VRGGGHLLPFEGGGGGVWVGYSLWACVLGKWARTKVGHGTCSVAASLTATWHLVFILEKIMRGTGVFTRWGWIDVPHGHRLWSVSVGGSGGVVVIQLWVWCHRHLSS
jgi:hypothetical protein